MGVFNLYKFTNVTSIAQVITNLKNAAEYEGWTTDAIDVSGLPDNPGYLYIHSTGNGNQNLYYSMKVTKLAGRSKVQNGDNSFSLRIYGNLGYNSSNAYDNQPGRWVVLMSESSMYLDGTPITVPVYTQYVFANNKQIIMFIDCYHPFTLYIPQQYWVNYSGRYCLGTFIGSIDSYKDDETEGNAMITNGGENASEMYSSLFGSFAYYYSAVSSVFSFYYFGMRKATSAFPGPQDVGLSIAYSYNLHPGYSYFTITPDTSYKPRQQLSFQYWRACTFNDFTNKGVIIKPVIFIKHAIGGYNYYLPIGELPYYASVHHPYYYAGQEVYFGQRKFIAMPIYLYTSPMGAMVEVNP